MRVLLGLSACGVSLLALLVQPAHSVVVPTAPDQMSYAMHAGALAVFGGLYLLYVYERRARPDLYEGRASAGPFMGVGVAAAFLAVLALPAARDIVSGREISEDEDAVVVALRAVVRAQGRFRDGDLDGDGSADYAEDLAELASFAAGELPAKLPQALRSPRPTAYRGYHFAAMRGGWDGPFDPLRGFGAQASPAEHGRTGVLTFYVTADAKVYGKDTGGAPVLVVPRDPVPSGWSLIEGLGDRGR